MAGRAPVRIFVGSWAELGGWQRVYETPDALEIDESTGFAGTRRRVFYDEVLLVTYHRFVGWGAALASAALAGFLGLMALAFWAGDDYRTAVTLAVLSVIPGVLAVLRLIVKKEAVTVFGRRSRARVAYWANRHRARAAYERICARVRHAQQRAAVRPSGT